MPAATTMVMQPAMRMVQSVPADEASVRLMPSEEPTPSQVQVRHRLLVAESCELKVVKPDIVLG